MEMNCVNSDIVENRLNLTHLYCITSVHLKSILTVKHI
jgi:hypothetical protein